MYKREDLGAHDNSLYICVGGGRNYYKNDIDQLSSVSTKERINIQPKSYFASYQKIFANYKAVKW